MAARFERVGLIRHAGLTGRIGFMTDQLPYADYVRIEIHAEGRVQIVEFRPEQWQKVRAQATLNERPADDLFLLTDAARRVSDGVDVTLRVTGPTVTVTRA